jgi:hypothetical protein
VALILKVGVGPAHRHPLPLPHQPYTGDPPHLFVNLEEQPPLEKRQTELLGRLINVNQTPVVLFEGLPYETLVGKLKCRNIAHSQQLTQLRQVVLL